MGDLKTPKFSYEIYRPLKNLTDDEFNEVITTLIKQKSQADVTLHEEFTRYWNEITNSEYLFDRNQQEIKLLESCDKKEMIKFMSNLLASDKARVLMRSKTEKHRRKLSVQVIGKVIIYYYYITIPSNIITNLVFGPTVGQY